MSEAGLYVLLDGISSDEQEARNQVNGTRIERKAFDSAVTDPFLPCSSDVTLSQDAKPWLRSFKAGG
jgi:hypothetical protein